MSSFGAPATLAAARRKVKVALAALDESTYRRVKAGDRGARHALAAVLADELTEEEQFAVAAYGAGRILMGVDGSIVPGFGDLIGCVAPSTSTAVLGATGYWKSSGRCRRPKRGCCETMARRGNDGSG